MNFKSLFHLAFAVLSVLSLTACGEKTPDGISCRQFIDAYPYPETETTRLEIIGLAKHISEARGSMKGTYSGSFLGAEGSLEGTHSFADDYIKVAVKSEAGEYDDIYLLHSEALDIERQGLGEIFIETQYVKKFVTYHSEAVYARIGIYKSRTFHGREIVSTRHPVSRQLVEHSIQKCERTRDMIPRTEIVEHFHWQNQGSVCLDVSGKIVPADANGECSG